MDIRRKSYQLSKQSVALSPKAIRDFQEAYSLEYGIQLTPQQAQTLGLQFLQFMKHIMKPIPTNNGQYNYGKK